MCVCAPTVFKPGSQIDLSAFSAPFFGIFDVSQRTLLPKSVSCSSPLACSSHLALELCTAVLPSTASLPMLRLGWNQQTLTEHCRTRQAPSERQLRMSGCLWCLFGRMCLFSVKAALNWKRTRTFSRAQQATLFLN